MLFDVINFLFEVASTLIGGACLLRMYMHWRGMGLGKALGVQVKAQPGLDDAAAQLRILGIVQLHAQA